MGCKVLNLSQGEIVELSIKCFEQRVTVVAPKGVAQESSLVTMLGVWTAQVSGLPLIPSRQSPDRLPDAAQRSGVFYADDGERFAALVHFHNAHPGLSAPEQRRGASC